MTRRHDTLLIAVFAIVICLPAVGAVFGLGRSDLGEKRAAAKPPSLTLGAATLDVFPKQVDAWWLDHFGFRAPMVKAHAHLRYRVFGVPAQSHVIAGRDGWLFYGTPYIRKDFRRLDPFTEEELIAWRRMLEERRAWLAERNVRYVFTLAPNKHAVYGRYLPGRLNRVGSQTRYDQLVAYLKAHSDVTVVDPLPALREAAAHERVYYKTDSHWNDRGARIAAERIVGRALPAARTERTAPGGDLAQMLSLGDVIDEHVLAATPAARRARWLNGDRGSSKRIKQITEVDDPTLPRAVVFRDSFGSLLVPWLAECHRRAVYVNNTRFDTALIEKETPDVVIEELAERKLHTLPKNPQPVRDAYLRRLWNAPRATNVGGTDPVELPGRAARLTGPALPAGGVGILRLAVTSPAIVTVRVRYGDRTTKRRLRAGRNDLLIELVGANPGDRPEIELDPVPAPYQVHTLEVR